MNDWPYSSLLCFINSHRGKLGEIIYTLRAEGLLVSMAVLSWDNTNTCTKTHLIFQPVRIKSSLSDKESITGLKRKLTAQCLIEVYSSVRLWYELLFRIFGFVCSNPIINIKHNTGRNPINVYEPFSWKSLYPVSTREPTSL